MNDKKSSNGNVIIVDNSLIQKKIQFIRNMHVMIDRDIAELFDVETKRLNEQVKRNIERFPEEFCFQLNDKEKADVIAKCDHLKKLKFSPNLPYAFTEQGVAMLSVVIRSETAVKMSVQIMKAFVKMRHFSLKMLKYFLELKKSNINKLRQILN